jgi:hypothetical protein
MIVTVKRRFRSILLETLGEHVDSPAGAEEELWELMEALGQPQCVAQDRRGDSVSMGRMSTPAVGS